MKTMHRVYQWMILLFFCLLIIIPVLTFSFSGSEISETENRNLAKMPSFDNLTSRLISGEWTKEMEDWLNDHIGKRAMFRRVYTQLTHKILGISTVSTVIIGQDGWLYFNKDNNLSIAKGTYPLTEEIQKTIAEKQKLLADWYSSRNIHYVLLLTPSKLSIYPDFLPFRINENYVFSTPAEITEKILLQEKACTVVNVQTGFLQARKEAPDCLLFFKTDTHWNPRGSYMAYRTLISQLVDTEEPITVQFDDKEKKRAGDLSSSLELRDERDLEMYPIPHCEWTAKKINPDTHLIEIVKNAFLKQGIAYIEPVVYTNNFIKNGRKLVIYGDSMTADHLFFPNYLAEHFEMIVQLRLRSPSREVEDEVGATDVVFQSTERLISVVLRKIDISDFW